MSGAAAGKLCIEFADQVFLAFSELDRRLNMDTANQVAGLATTHRTNALAADSEQLARLGTRRNLERYLTVERRHLNSVAEGSGSVADRHLTGEMAPITHEYRMRPDADLDVQIARRAAVLTRPHPHRRVESDHRYLRPAES